MMRQIANYQSQRDPKQDAAQAISLPNEGKHQKERNAPEHVMDLQEQRSGFVEFGRGRSPPETQVDRQGFEAKRDGDRPDDGGLASVRHNTPDKKTGTRKVLNESQHTFNRSGIAAYDPRKIKVSNQRR